MRYLLGIVLSIGVVCGQSAGDAKNGKVLFKKYGCWQCHGDMGQGGNAGARLSQTRLNQNGFSNYVRNPPSGGMPPYRLKVMGNQDLADIFAFVKSLPEPAKNIPLLSQ